MSNPNRICFTPEPGDSIDFGSSVSINNKYLAIGDPGANRVVIYTRNNSGGWSRTKSILPPIDSTPYKVGRGFGSKLQLDGKVLAISAIILQRTKEVTNPEDFTYSDNRLSSFYGMYLTRLDSEAKIEPIDLSGERIADSVQFDLLFKEKVRRIILPKNGEKYFGAATAIYNNLFLVGSPSRYTGGGAWLFDLDTLQNPPLKISASDAYLGTTVAVSKQFAAVGELAKPVPLPKNAPRLRSKTLIRAINNGSTTIINSCGELSLSNNILAVMLPPTPDGQRNSLLEVFRLDDNATPHLILKYKNLKHAFVQNGVLITVKKRYNLKMCIRPIS